jgi:hypothetical protein
VCRPLSVRALLSPPPMFGWGGWGRGENLLCEPTSWRDNSVDRCRKVLLKALQGSTGPFTQMLTSLFLQAAVADSLHVACGMWHGQNQRRGTSPRHCTITWGIYCLQRWALQRSWRQGCPASPPQGDTLILSRIHHHPSKRCVRKQMHRAT